MNAFVEATNHASSAPDYLSNPIGHQTHHKGTKHTMPLLQRALGASGTAAHASMAAPVNGDYGGRRLVGPALSNSSCLLVPMRWLAFARSLSVRRFDWSRKRDIVFIGSNYEQLRIHSKQATDNASRQTPKPSSPSS